MVSRITQLEDLHLRSVIFWLPPGGRDNGVWASTWLMLAELDSADVAALLARLHDADVGAYAARASGRRGLSHAPANLYVDRDQLGRATDVVMQYLRAKNDPPPMAVPRRAPRKAPVPVAGRSASARAAVTAAKILVGALVIAGFMVMAYLGGTHWLAMTHQKAHRLPPSHLPGITNTRP